MVEFARRSAGAVMRRVDTMFSRGALIGPRRDPLTPAERIAAAEALLSTFPPDLGADADAYFPIVGGGGWSRSLVRPLGDGYVVDLATPSRITPVFPAEAAKFEALKKNGSARARHFRHQSRHRTAVVFVHGFMAGDLLVEELEWPTHAFYERGLDVVLAVLPGHGPRKGNRLWDPPEWPAGTPQFSIEGFRQAVGELRGLVSHLLADGVDHVAVVGMSLGGYTSALLSTVESRLALVAPFVPLASTADFLRDNGQLVGTPAEVVAIHALLERTFASVSPFTRPCLVPQEGRMVLGGAYDMVTPLSHSNRIAAHFGVETTVFPGAHLLQYGRWQAWRAVLANLRARGLAPRRR